MMPNKPMVKFLVGADSERHGLITIPDPWAYTRGGVQVPLFCAFTRQVSVVVCLFVCLLICFGLCLWISSSCLLLCVFVFVGLVFVLVFLTILRSVCSHELYSYLLSLDVLS